MTVVGEVTSPPAWPSAVTVLGSLVAAALVALTLDTADIGSFRLSLIGYALGAVLVPIAAATHRHLREESKRSPYFDPRRRYDRWVLGALSLGLLASGWHAFVIATELAR